MKRLVLSLVLVLGLLVVSCGPSKEELEQKRINDSIAQADSIALVQKVADSIAKADSIKVADSIAKLQVKK